MFDRDEHTLMLDSANLDPLQTLRAIATWMKSKDEDDFAGVKAAAEEAADNALKKVKARITRLKNEAKKQGGLADKIGVLQKIQDAERLQRTMRNQIFAVEDAIKAALKQKDASLMGDFSSLFPEAVVIVEKALSGVGGATAPEQNPAESEADNPAETPPMVQVKAESQNQSGIIKGRPNPVKTAKGTRVDTVLALVEADSLIVSHDPTSGNENPAFPQELQPRDRGRDSSIQWVQKVAASLDPDSLGRTSRADTGAPIIGPDHVVESGNGRSMAVKLAYQRGTADDYRQWLVDEAGYFGFTPEQVESMRQPVLVRLRTSDIDRKAFVVEANQDDKLTFTATERAKTDAKRLDSHLLGLFSPSEDGDVTAASNQRFVQGFLQSLGDTEAAQYLTKDGKPTVALVHRLRAAVFSKAYNDDRLLEMMADQTKPEIQNVLNALSAAAPRFIDAQGYSRAGTEDVASGLVDGIEQSLDQRVVDAIVQATNTLMAARSQQQDVAEYVKQLGMFEDLPEGVPELAVFLAQNGRSAKKMAIAFKAMAEFVKQDAIGQQSDNLFGEPEPPRMVDVVAAANAAIEREYGPEGGAIGGLFDSASMTPLQTLKSILHWAKTRDDGPDGKVKADGRTYTFKITKRGRKWFSGTVGKGYKAELFINGTTTGLKEGQEVKFMGQDLSVRNKYGTTIRYAATKIINDANARQVEWFRDAQKWLGYAESDAKEGKWFTNALQKAQSYRLLVPELAERIDALTQQSKEGLERLKAQKQQQDAAAQAASEQAAPEASIPASQRRKLFSERDRNRPALNQPERLDNRVVVYTSKGKSFMIREDDMDFYRTEWDGTSGAYYYYREATAEEIRQLEQREAVEKADADAQRARRNAIAALKKRIETEGTTPRNEDGSQITIGGTRYLNTQNIYGSGDWFEVTDSAIWYVMNHGMDGDNWAANNVRTGGAGGIGSFIPYDPAIHEQLKEWDGKSDGGSSQENHVLDSIANAEGAWRVNPVAPVLGGGDGQACYQVIRYDGVVLSSFVSEADALRACALLNDEEFLDTPLPGSTWFNGTLLKWPEISMGPPENKLPSADQIGTPVVVGIRDQGDMQLHGVIAGVRFSQRKVYYRVALQVQGTEWAAVIECPSECVYPAEGASLDAIEGGILDSTRMDSLADPDQTVYAVQQVPTDLISTDPYAYQWRDNTDDDGTEDRPIDPYETWDEDTPPLILHRRSDSTLWVVDGHHRLAKAERLDVPEVPAVVLDEDDGYTVAAMRALCAMLNLTNEASEADSASYDPVILAGTAKHLMVMQ